MPTVEVAQRKIYISRGCVLNEDGDYKTAFSIQDYHIELYIGNKPNLPIPTKSKKSPIPWVPDKNQPIKLSIKYGPIEESDFNGELFTDILCWRNIEITDQQYTQFKDSNTELEVKNSIFDTAKNSFEQDYDTVCNVILGYVGLRFHPQFLYEQIDAQYWIRLNQNHTWSIEGFYSDNIHLLEKISITENGKKNLEDLDFSETETPKSISQMALCFGLLINGWHEHVPSYKFINFFIALEIAINTYGQEINIPDKTDTLNTIKNTIRASSLEPSDKSNALDLLNKCRPLRLSLKEKFTHLAETAQFETWQKDIEAFTKFYSIRNKIFHGGATKITLQIEDKDNTAFELSTLTEKYINWVYFRDANIYKSKFREQPKLLNFFDISN